MEGATHRRVITYMSQINHDPELALELFVLEPSEQPLLAEHEVEIGEGQVDLR